MKVLVTGSAGFVGQELVYLLRSRGIKVIGIDRRPQGDDLERNADVFIHDDILNQSSIAPVHFDACIHAACEVGGFLYNAHAHFLVNREREILHHLARWCQRNGCHRCIYISSIAVFEGDETFTHAPLCSDSQSTPYARAKALGERLVSELFAHSLIVRPTNVFGRAQLKTHEAAGESHVIPDLLTKIREGSQTLEVLGDGTQCRNFLHVSDLCHFLAMALESNLNGWVNIRSEITVTIRDLARILLDYSGESRRLIFRPEFSDYERIKIRDFDLGPATKANWRAKIADIVAGLGETACAANQPSPN